MLNKLQLITSRLLGLVEQTDDPNKMLLSIIGDISKAMESSVLLVDEKGKILVYECMPNGCRLNTTSLDDDNYIDTPLNEQLKNIVEMNTDISLSNLHIKNNLGTSLDHDYTCILPVVAVYKRIATMMVYRENTPFTAGEITVIQTSLVIITIVLSNRNNQRDMEITRKNTIVKGAVDSLSYSELEAILYIFEELNSSEGLLIASKVADRVGITRSVIVNSLRKLESAGLIESRSLGVKGTYIKVLNDKLLDELGKLRN